MASYDRRTYYIGVIAALAGVISTFLAYRAIDASWEIAKVSGSLEKSAMAVSIGGYTFPDNAVARVIIGAPNLSGDSVVSIGSIPLAFTSTGGRSIEELTLTFQYHKILKRNALEAMTLSAYGEFGAADVEHQFTESLDTSFVSYRFALLNPGASVMVAEPIYLAPTTLDIDAPVTTKDGVHVIASMRVSFAMKYGVTVSAKDLPIRSFPIEFSTEKVDSLEELGKRQSISNIVSNVRQEVRGGLSMLSYFSALLFSSPKGGIFLVFCPQEKHDSDGKVLFGPTPSHQIGLVTFPLLSWDLLFKRTG